MVARRPNAERNSALAVEGLNRQKEASVELFAIDGERIDLVGGVGPHQDALACATTRATADDDDVSGETRRFALHPYEPRSKVKDEVVAFSVADGLEHADADPNRRESDSSLRYGAALLAWMHLLIVVV
jgi:hypothetical protein